MTVQQIQWEDRVNDDPVYKETSDDWSCAAFWYEPIPSAQLPVIPSYEERIADLDIELLTPDYP